MWDEARLVFRKPWEEVSAQYVFQSFNPCFSVGISDDFWRILQLPVPCHSVLKNAKLQRWERPPERKEARSERGTKLL